MGRRLGTNALSTSSLNDGVEGIADNLEPIRLFIQIQNKNNTKMITERIEYASF